MHLIVSGLHSLALAAFEHAAIVGVLFGVDRLHVSILNSPSLPDLAVWAVGPEPVGFHMNNVCRLEFLFNNPLDKVHRWVIKVPEDSPYPILVALPEYPRLPARRISDDSNASNRPIKDALLDVRWERVGELGTQLLLGVSPHLRHLLICAGRFVIESSATLDLGLFHTLFSSGRR